MTATTLQAFNYNLVNYIKAFEASFTLLADVLFGLDGFETPFAMDVPSELFKELINGRADIPVEQVSNKVTQMFLKKLFLSIKTLFGQVYGSFRSLNQGVQALSKTMRRATEAQKKEVKDLVKLNSFVMQALNNMFETIGFSKALVCSPVLTDEEELNSLSLLQPVIQFGEEKLTDKYHVFCLEQSVEDATESVPLQSSNACQIELDFSYP